MNAERAMEKNPASAFIRNHFQLALPATGHSEQFQNAGVIFARAMTTCGSFRAQFRNGKMVVRDVVEEPRGISSDVAKKTPRGSSTARRPFYHTGAPLRMTPLFTVMSLAALRVPRSAEAAVYGTSGGRRMGEPLK
jgi:hypothetical protein